MSGGRTTSPVNVGSSVLAVKYNDGVLVCADTLVSYGSQKRFKGVNRIFPIGNQTLISAAGEHSDFQFITKTLTQLETDDWVHQDRHLTRPSEIASYLSRLCYGKRNRMNPLYNFTVVAGFDETRKTDPRFLAHVDLFGTYFEEEYIATGLGSYFAIPLLREKARPDMPYEEAVALLKECMTVLCARDCQGHNEVKFARVTANGAEVDEVPTAITPEWNFVDFMRPTKEAGLVGSSW